MNIRQKSDRDKTYRMHHVCCMSTETLPETRRDAEAPEISEDIFVLIVKVKLAWKGSIHDSTLTFGQVNSSAKTTPKLYTSARSAWWDAPLYFGTTSGAM